MENIKVLQNQKMIKFFLIVVLGSIILAISAKIKEERLKEQNDDVQVYYAINSPSLNIQNSMILEDSQMRTSYGGAENDATRTRDAAMQGVILNILTTY